MSTHCLVGHSMDVCRRYKSLPFSFWRRCKGCQIHFTISIRNISVCRKSSDSKCTLTPASRDHGESMNRLYGSLDQRHAHTNEWRRERESERSERNVKRARDTRTHTVKQHLFCFAAFRFLFLIHLLFQRWPLTLSFSLSRFSSHSHRTVVFAPSFLSCFVLFNVRARCAYVCTFSGFLPFICCYAFFFVCCVYCSLHYCGPYWMFVVDGLKRHWRLCRAISIATHPFRGGCTTGHSCYRQINRHKHRVTLASLNHYSK